MLSRAVDDLLFRRPPRLDGHAGGALIGETGELLPQVIDCAARLDGTTLCIQGPPGTGKTFSAARDHRRAAAPGAAHRRHRHQPQGDPQPAQGGGEGTGRRQGSGAALQGGQRRRTMATTRCSPMARWRASSPNKWPRWWATARCWWAAPPGCSAARSWPAGSTTSSSTRRGRSRWRTPWRWGSRPGTSSWWETRCSWASPSRAPIPARPAAPPWTICSTATPPSRPIAASSSARPTGCTSRSAASSPTPSTTGGWAARWRPNSTASSRARARPSARSAACAGCRCRTRAVPRRARRR